jgi:hypothetical protein
VAPLMSFSWPVNPATVTASSITLAGPAGPVSGSRSVAGSMVVFTPDQPFAWGTEYTFTAGAGIADTSGQALGTSINVKFRTRAPTWTAETPLPGSGDAYHPAVVVDRAGNGTLAWLELQGSQYVVMTSRFDAASGNWSAPLRISASPNVANAPLGLAVDGGGNVFAVWTVLLLNQGVIIASRFDAAAGTWGAESVIFDVNGGGAAGPVVAADAAGNAIAVWAQAAPPSGDYTVRANRFSGGAWLGPQTIQSLPGKVDSLGLPSLAMDAAGNATAVWAQSSRSCTQTFPTRVDDADFNANDPLEGLVLRGGNGAATGDWEIGLGVNTQRAGSFTTGQIAWSNGKRYGWTLQVGTDGRGTVRLLDGSVAVASVTYPANAGPMRLGNALQMWVKTSAGQGTAQVAMTLDQIGGQSVSESIVTAGNDLYSEARATWFLPALEQGATAAGTITLSWPSPSIPSGSRLTGTLTIGNVPCDAGANTAGVYASRFSAATSSWGQQTLISTPSSTAGLPAVAMDGIGNAMAIWPKVDPTSGHAEMRASRFDAANGSWGAVQEIQDGSGGSAPYDVRAGLSVDANGNATAVWMQRADSIAPYRIHSNRYSAARAAWGTPRVIQSGSNRGAWPRVGVDGVGNAVSVWNQRYDVDKPTAARFDASSESWQAPVQIQSQSGDAGGSAPALAVQSNGNAFAAWTRLEPGTNRHALAVNRLTGR